MDNAIRVLPARGTVDVSGKNGSHVTLEFSWSDNTTLSTMEYRFRLKYLEKSKDPLVAPRQISRTVHFEHELGERLRVDFTKRVIQVMFELYVEFPLAARRLHTKLEKAIEGKAEKQPNEGEQTKPSAPPPEPAGT